MGGSVYDGFAMTSGVRQGCPLSPLLFVLVVDILLRTLLDSTPKDTTCIRAFADDVGMVIADACTRLPIVLDVFEHFACFSGLRLSLPKTTVIPLWCIALKETKLLITRASPKAGSMAFDTWGTYLGFTVGPTRQEHMWTKCLSKFQSRAMTWKDSQQGLFHSCTLYNVFVVSVLSYIWQLSAPPQ